MIKAILFDFDGVIIDSSKDIAAAVNQTFSHFGYGNLTELEIIDKVAAELSKVQSISMRIKPGVEAHTHHFIQTATVDSKFGFSGDWKCRIFIGRSICPGILPPYQA